MEELEKLDIMEDEEMMELYQKALKGKEEEKKSRYLKKLKN